MLAARLVAWRPQVASISVIQSYIPYCVTVIMSGYGGRQGYRGRGGGRFFGGGGGGGGRGGGGGGGRGRHGGGRGGGGGRGQYYKNKYGRKRGADSATGGGGGGDSGGPPPSRMRTVAPAAQLQQTLQRIDGKPYGAYRDIERANYQFGGAGLAHFVLVVDRAQSDAYAPPSRAHVEVPYSVAAFPAEYMTTPTRKAALADFLARVFSNQASAIGADQKAKGGGQGWHGAKGGDLQIDSPSQHVLQRTSVVLTKSGIQARFTIALPARGRTIMGRAAATVLLESVPELVRTSLLFKSINAAALRAHVLSVEDQEALRGALDGLGLAAFVANGAILPRASGASDKPMNAKEAVKFSSPSSLECTITLPNAGKVTGMGIPKGVTIIVGGGFHGKSTLLKALEVGVYNHIPGDGREFVASSSATVKIRAEDGRAVSGVNISNFICNLPLGRDTAKFSTPDASGSTSQAANIIEALEVGCKVLLIDEDTAATNFMIRDRRMQLLVQANKEPITPFIARVRELYDKHGVSSILVIGGAGDYFEVADLVIQLENYTPADVTVAARQVIADTGGATIDTKSKGPFAAVVPRCPVRSSCAASGKVVSRGKDVINFGEQDIDMSAVEQLVEASQLKAITDALLVLRDKYMTGSLTLSEAIDALEADIDKEGLDVLKPGWFYGSYARPRRFEIAAALNRIRSLKVIQAPHKAARTATTASGGGGGAVASAGGAGAGGGAGVA